MSHVIVWTQEDCPLCEKVKALLGDQDVEERPASALLSGDDKDIQAMTQLAMQDMQLPLVQVDGEFIAPQELIENAA